MKIFKDIYLILGLLGALLGVASFKLISFREAIGLFVISLILVLCLRPIKDDVNRSINKLVNIRKLLEKIKHNLKVVCDALIESPGIKFDHGKLKNYSPVGLSQEGKKYLEEIGFIEIFNKYSQDFFDFIDSEEPKTKYDVEVTARKSFLFLSDKEYFNPLKTYLYEHPQEENLRGMAQITGVYIRDKYLKKHPEIIE